MIEFHWDRLSFGTLVAISRFQQSQDDTEQLTLMDEIISPLLDGLPLVQRPLLEAQAIIAQFLQEARTKIPEAVAAFAWAMGGKPATFDRTTSYIAQPGSDWN